MAELATRHNPSVLALLFSACTSAAAFAAPEPGAPVKGCVAISSAALPVTNNRANDIDYATLNRVLLSTDAAAPLRELPGMLATLQRSAAPEAASVKSHLQLALAQAQARSGQISAAMDTLKTFPLDSSQAAAAIFLQAELEVKSAHADVAIRWLRQLGELFPDDPLAVHALLLAAELRAENPAQALALLQQASDLADRELLSARHWQQRSRATDFLDDVNTEKLPASLWRLAHSSLTDPVFAGVDSAQAEARRQLQCLTAQQDERLRLLQKNPLLLADLAHTVNVLDVQLLMARRDLDAREADFLASAKRWKECRARAADCAAEKTRHDTQGRALTGWRNRVHDLEKKRDFLRREQKVLPARWQQDHVDSAAIALQLTEKRSAARAVMKALLQQTLATSLKDWENLTAQAHYRLALAQDPRTARAAAAELPAP